MSQHCFAGHWSSFWHGQVFEHWRVAGSQHWPARQSAADLQHGAHDPFSQHLSRPHSESSQQVASGKHVPPQQCLPAPQWPSFSQAHAPHFLVVGSQHWLARQSAADLQHGAHELLLQHLPGPQS